MADAPLRRLVFYVHGFDRRRARFFNLWQKREARAYRARFAADLEIGDLTDDHWRISGQGVETEFHFLDWTRVISARFDQPFWRSVLDMVALFGVALKQGLFGRIRRADKVMGLLMLWAFLPVVLMCGTLVGAAFFGALQVVFTGLFWVLVFWLLHRFDRYFGVYYAAHVAWAARRIALRDHPALEACVGIFQAKLKDLDADEVVLVGHSIGGALAVRLMADLPEEARLLTIGQSIPLVSFQNEAGFVRADLEDLGRTGRGWIDISAGRDPLGFHGFDPSGGGARCYSAHLARAFGASTLRALRWRGFDMHFLYFKAPELSGAPFDWFGILSGKTRLEERFLRDAPLDGAGHRRASF